MLIRLMNNMSVFLNEIIKAVDGILILFGFLIVGVALIGLFLSILMGLGFRNKFGVYDPLYKGWFDYALLNEEQESRLIPGSNRLADPQKGTKKSPFWKEQPTFRLKIITFLTMGNSPRPRKW